MSDPNVKKLTQSKQMSRKHCLNLTDMEDVKRADSSPSTNVTSRQVARRMKALTSPLSRQPKLLRDSMKEVRQSSPKRSEDTSGLNQGSSRAPNTRFNRRTIEPNDETPQTEDVHNSPFEQIHTLSSPGTCRKRA